MNNSVFTNAFFTKVEKKNLACLPDLLNFESLIKNPGYV